MLYVLNTDAREDGTIVLHAEHCQYVPKAENREKVGEFDACDAALGAARDGHGQVKPCGVCCTACDG